MSTWIVAVQEIRVGVHNRWALATALLMAALALSLTLLGSAPTGVVKAEPLAVVVVSLVSLSIFLVPLIALLLSFDAIVGEHERGTLILLLSYPVARWQVMVGKCLGQSAILGAATVLGYGAAAGALWVQGSVSGGAWQAFGGMVLASVLLGVVFVAIGCLASTLVRERATAAGMAVGVWLFFVLLYDTAVLGVLVADQGRVIGKDMLEVLLLLNPADVYRLFNMTATESVSVYSGMAGPGDPTALPPLLYLAVLLLWALVPLALAVLAFSRRPV